MALSSRLSLEERPIEIAPAIENHASKHRLGDKVWITVAAGPTVLKVALTLCEGDKGGGGGVWVEGVGRWRSEGVER